MSHHSHGNFLLWMSEIKRMINTDFMFIYFTALHYQGCKVCYRLINYSLFIMLSLWERITIMSQFLFSFPYIFHSQGTFLVKVNLWLRTSQRLKKIHGYISLYRRFSSKKGKHNCTSNGLNFKDDKHRTFQFLRWFTSFKIFYICLNCFYTQEL